MKHHSSRAPHDLSFFTGLLILSIIPLVSAAPAVDAELVRRNALSPLTPICYGDGLPKDQSQWQQSGRDPSVFQENEMSAVSRLDDLCWHNTQNSVGCYCNEDNIIECKPAAGREAVFAAFQLHCLNHCDCFPHTEDRGGDASMCLIGAASDVTDGPSYMEFSDGEEVSSAKSGSSDSLDSLGSQKSQPFDGTSIQAAQIAAVQAASHQADPLPPADEVTPNNATAAEICSAPECKAAKAAFDQAGKSECKDCGQRCRWPDLICSGYCGYCNLDWNGAILAAAMGASVSGRCGHKN